MLEKEYNYFLKNRKTILQKYEKKFIVIVNEEIVDSYDSEEEALRDAASRFKMETFLIQKVSRDEEDTTQRFFSRVYVK